MTLVMLFSVATAYPTIHAEPLALENDAPLWEEAQDGASVKEPLLPTAIPTELISAEKVQKAGHVRRLPQAEGDMNTVMLANEDGTHSMYLFSYPVKYTDEDCNVRDAVVNDESDNYLWEGVVVMEVGDYLNTIPCYMSSHA